MPEADLPEADLPEAVLPADLPVADLPDACLAGVDFPDPWIDLADTGFVGVSIGGASTTIGVGETIAAGIVGDVLVTSTLASIAGISLMGEATAAVTVEVIVAGSGNVYTGDGIGGVGCVVVTLVVVLGTVCENVRDRTTRLTCAGGKPKLYSTISSSKRFRLIERDELKLKRNTLFVELDWWFDFTELYLRRFWSPEASGVDGVGENALPTSLLFRFISNANEFRISISANYGKFCFGE